MTYETEEILSATPLGVTGRQTALEAHVLQDGEVCIYNGDEEISHFDNIADAREEFLLF